MPPASSPRCLPHGTHITYLENILTPRSILLVDSDNDLAETIGAMLRALDYPVTRLEDEMRALSAMHGIRFGLLVTTLRRDADKTLAFAREAKLLLPQLKVLVVTGAGQGESGHNAAVDAVLHKPFDMAALANIVSSLTSGTRAGTR